MATSTWRWRLRGSSMISDAKSSPNSSPYRARHSAGYQRRSLSGSNPGGDPGLARCGAPTSSKAAQSDVSDPALGCQMGSQGGRTS